MTEVQSIPQRMLGLKNQLQAGLAVLESVWEDIGLPQDKKDTRIDLVFFHISNMIKGMVSEEEERRDILKQNIEAYRTELEVLCEELHVAPSRLIGTKLFEVEKELKREMEVWLKEKQDRLDSMTSLKLIEQALCDSMSRTPMYIPSGTVPTREQIDALRQHTDKLANEKNKRFGIFVEQKNKISSMMHELAEEIVTEFEQDVLVEDPECFVLSDANMESLKLLQEQYAERLSKRKAQMEQLWASLHSLWLRLEMAEEERASLRSRVVDRSAASVLELQTEIARCEKLKLEHLHEFISKLREELVMWWDRCFYSKSQRDKFSGFTSEDFSESLLEAHECALGEVKAFYEDNKEMLQKIEKRTELWNKMVEFEEKEHDVNRYKNRGGNLLAEEKEKKKVLHLLPKVEEQLKAAVEEWEAANGRQFLIGGVRFFDFCRLQWEEYKQHKELQKQQRMEQKEREMQSELMYGSKPTPAKRRLGAASNASQTPKQRKLNSTLAKSVPRLDNLSQFNSVFASPALPPRVNARTPGLAKALERTPAANQKVAPPVTPLSLRSSTRKLNEVGRVQSCASLASPHLKKTARDLGLENQCSSIRKTKSERKLNNENTSPQSSDDIKPLTSESEVENVASTYEEFTSALHSAKKPRYRSTNIPEK